MAFLIVDGFRPIHEAYIHSLGRGLTVCQHLEDAAHHVMVTWAVTDAIMDGSSDHDALREIAIALRNASLGGSVKRLKGASDFGADRADVIDAGREARNWLVHKSALAVEAAREESHVLEELPELIRQLHLLCDADKLLSVASYEICEREPAPDRH